MNYSMQGMTKTIPELFVILKSTKVEIKKEHQVLMIDKTTSFKKRAKGKKEELQRRIASKLLLKWRSSSLDPSLELSASTAKGLVTGSRTTPSIWRIRRMAKWTKVYLIYRFLICALLVFIVAPEYLILVRLLRLVTRKSSYIINRD